MRVLVADDDADFRLLVRLALERNPSLFVVAEAADGNEAVAGAVATRPDLALLDCEMPGADAFDALDGIRQAAPGCRIVLLSGYGEDEVRRASDVAGAVGYLRKDVPASRLAEELLALSTLVGTVQDVLDQAATQFEGDLSSARAARQFVTDALAGWGLEALADTVALLVSEVVTNAVVHARSVVDVEVHLTPDAARVEISDSAPGEPVVRAARGYDESGRGMAIVESLARAWGVRSRRGGGKTIWFEVDRPSAPAATAR
ncbi:MAG: response regulator [Acidimicrobiales bacterium]